MTPSFIGVGQAAKAYHISPRDIYMAIHCGSLRAYKPGGRRFHIRISDLEDWIMSKPFIPDSEPPE